MRSSDYHPTALAALRKWTKGQRDGLVFLGQITRANLQRDQIERDLWNSHQNLRKTLDRMRSALDKLLAFMKRPETPAATYEEKEIHFLLGLVAQVADRMSMHYETIRKIVDDALSCESHETLTIYTSVWLSQPDVDDEPYSRLVQVCELYEGSS